MGFFTWILAGALVGAAASALIGNRDRNARIVNVALGIAGVLAGGWLLGMVIGASAFRPGEFGLQSLLVSVLGAAVLLAALQGFREVVERRAPKRHVSPTDVSALSQNLNRHQVEDIGMNRTIGIGRALRPLVTAGFASVLMLIGACASTPPAPDSALDGARVAISNAEKAEAGRFAGPELGEAREKLALADNAVRDKDMVTAERFAQESQVQAELASARTAAAKARSVNEEMERGADALTEEMQRAGEPK